MSTSRRQILRSAGAAGLALLPLGARGQQLRSDPSAPWSEAPLAAAHADPRIRALAWAVLAPNPHNRQPWVAELPAATPDTMLLFCDLDRRLPVTDPLDRQITIGLGCFIELFRMAAAAEGLDLVVTPFPDGAAQPRLDGRPVARLRLVPGGVADPLFAVADRRRSVKAPYDMDRPVPAAALQAVASAVAPPGRCLVTAEASRVAALRDLVWRAWMVEATTPAAHLESVDLMRLGREAVTAQPDGISIYGPGLDAAVASGQITHAAMLPGQPGYDFMVSRYRAMMTATPAFVWTTTPGAGRADQLQAGRDWLRVNLAATAAGLALQPVSQALQEYPEMDGPYREAQRELGEGGVVQMMGRLGYGPAVPPTPRWPAMSRIRTA
ncbi:Acg family FMN-binding oxidoreductase [Falsiroseomonas tokyonensis]|uniref:Acg family FMN-binding oxidoreductase n=1 Tax=Falsiroseomonas tokyonensis TaxID=430521 RepID=A0ABV7BV67_9PROT|nr:hypothetical protein [Falsiroseomonas tokyonensis]MBU8539407.1 hypothetical protein [Falsiroseomonas tokyonensis]